jgi:hypothetical protein
MRIEKLPKALSENQDELLEYIWRTRPRYRKQFSTKSLFKAWMKGSNFGLNHSDQGQVESVRFNSPGF